MENQIKKLRRVLGLTQQEFGNRIGVKRNTVATYEGGRSKPVDSVVALICREFNVNEAWLRTGEGEMFLPNPGDALDLLAQQYRLSESDCMIIQKFLSLKPEIRSAIANIIMETAASLSCGRN